MSDREKVTVVLGAGASHAVRNASVPVTNGLLQPPLARGLFNENFWPFRQHYRGAEVIGDRLGGLAEREANAFNLEESLTHYAHHPNPVLQRHYLDIPPYLRDVLVACTNGYTPSPANYLDLVSQLLEDGTHEVLFISLNYDVLLERALAIYDPETYRFTGLDHYLWPGRQALVAKIHGSTNWFVPMNSTQSRTFAEAVDRLVIDRYSPESVVVSDDQSLTMHMYASDGTRLYPWLTAPVLDKTTCCPTDHTHAVRSFVADCYKFIIIGSSGLDADLMELLNSQPGSVAVVHYVGIKPEIHQVKERFETRVARFRTPFTDSSMSGLEPFLHERAIGDILAKRI